jgi:hypothetical protein
MRSTDVRFASGPPKPDFSGDYILNRHASTLTPGAAGAVSSGVMHIEHREPIFRYRLTYFVPDKPLDVSYELPTDGRESQLIEEGKPTMISLRWDGDVLVFTERAQGTVTFRHELLENGRQLRITEQNRGIGRDQDNVFIFERQ